MNSPYPLDKELAKPRPRPSKIDFSRVRAQLPRQLTAYLFLLPALIAFGLFAWYPILTSIQMSFQNVSLTGPSEWVGLRNYELMLKDPAFGIVWRNVFEYTSWSLVLGFFVPVIIAMLVREVRGGSKGFFRVVYFLPTVVPAAVAVIIWRFIYDPDGGIANEFLRQIGAERQLWLQNAVLAKPALIAVMTWAGFGTTTLIYLASLQDISIDLYEAAELDGASPLRRVWHISLPHLYPVMSLMFILQIITVVQVFTEPFLLTNDGPGRETLTPAMNIYNRAFIRMNMGYASTWSVTMIVVLAVFSIIYRLANNRLNPNN